MRKTKENSSPDLSTVAGRLRHARGKHSQEDMARIIGKTTTAYGHYERGRNDVSNADANKICQFLNISLEWLLTGEGQMKTDEYRSPAKATLQVSEGHPIYGYASGAHSRIAINEGAIVGRVPERMPGMGQDGFYLIVHGDSMEPRLEQGARLGVSRQLPPRKGKLCVIEKIDGEVLVKEFVSKSDRELVCKQLNPPKTLKYSMMEIVAVYAVVGTSDY
jgi:repressor LexA